MKKLIAALLCACMTATLLAGCGSKTETNEAPEAATEAEAGTETEAEAAEEGLKIAIVTSPSGVDDRNFNQNNYNGILAFIEENPSATVTPVREETGDVAAAVQTVADIVADYDVIVCCGFQFAGITTIAEENPDVDFILVDAYPADPNSETGESIVVDNIYAMQFKEQEAGFCAGMAAALETTTGKVAVVNGIAYPSNVNYQYGFMSGVNYANKYYGATAEIVELPSYAGTDVTGANVGGNYVGDFNDEATGKVVGQALIDAGVDVILVAAGNSGNGVFTAAKEAEGVLCIAGDVDQFDDGVNGDGNIILTSVLKVMDMNVELQLNKVKDGTFAGENALLGGDTESTGFVSAEGRCQLSAETIADMEEAFAKVKTGEVVPAANFNGMTPDAFTGL